MEGVSNWAVLTFLLFYATLVVFLSFLPSFFLRYRQRELQTCHVQPKTLFQLKCLQKLVLQSATMHSCGCRQIKRTPKPGVVERLDNSRTSQLNDECSAYDRPKSGFASFFLSWLCSVSGQWGRSASASTSASAYTSISVLWLRETEGHDNERRGYFQLWLWMRGAQQSNTACLIGAETLNFGNKGDTEFSGLKQGMMQIHACCMLAASSSQQHAVLLLPVHLNNLN